MNKLMLKILNQRIDEGLNQIDALNEVAKQFGLFQGEIDTLWSMFVWENWT